MTDTERLDWLEKRQKSDLQCYTSTEGMKWRFGSQYFDEHPWFNSLREAIDATVPAVNHRGWGECVVMGSLEQEHARLMADAYELKKRLDNAERILRRLGYERCTAPACNCASYHRDTPEQPDV